MNMQDKKSNVQKALNKLKIHDECCRLCPRECGVNRKKGDRGYCRTGIQAILSHALIHPGEEPILSGFDDCRRQGLRGCTSGSGTVFFTGCHLKCSFCQNYQLSWENQGKPVTDEELAGTMLDLQQRGALNINLVSPTHLIVPVLRALEIAYEKGLHIPLVYNSNGYERTETLHNLEGVVDIYLPDFKYASSRIAQKYSGVNDYFFYTSSAVKEMVRQRPALIVDKEEIAREGVIIRHLVLPGQIEDSLAVLDWIGKNLDTGIGFSLMSQYQPCFRAPAELRRRLTPGEYARVRDHAEKLNIEMLFLQPYLMKAGESLVPDFEKESPFNWPR